MYKEIICQVNSSNISQIVFKISIKKLVRKARQIGLKNESKFSSKRPNTNRSEKLVKTIRENTYIDRWLFRYRCHSSDFDRQDFAVFLNSVFRQMSRRVFKRVAQTGAKISQSNFSYLIEKAILISKTICRKKSK